MSTVQMMAAPPMNGSSGSGRRRFMRCGAMLLLMASASAGAVLLKPTRHLADQLPALRLDAMVPAQIGPWRWAPELSTPTPPPQAGTLAARIYTQVLERTYVNDRGYRLMLSIAYGPDQRDGSEVHNPEFCYTAQGFVVSAVGKSRVSGPDGEIVLTRLDTRNASRAEPVSYWTTLGAYHVGDGAGRRLKQLRYGLQGLIPDGVVFRVSSLDGDRDRAFEAQREFVAALAGQIEPKARERLIGRASLD